MSWLGTKLDAGVRKFGTLPHSARRWLTVLAVPALAVGLMIGTLLGPSFLGATGLPTVLDIPLVADAPSDSGFPKVTAGTGADAGPTLGTPTGNVAAPASSAPGPASTGTSTSNDSTVPVATVPVEPDPQPQHQTRTPDNTGHQTHDAGADDPEPEGPTLTGTVVRVNPVAHSYALADGEATLVAVHAAHLPPTGRTVSVVGRELSNGTYAEDGKRRLTGKASAASFAGTVTYSDPVDQVYTVSARGSSVLVHVPPAEAGAPRAATHPPFWASAPGRSSKADPSPPTVGSQVTVSVRIDPADPPTGTAPPGDGSVVPDPGASIPADPIPVPGDVTPSTPDDAAAPSLCQEPDDATAPEPPAAPRFTLQETKVEVADEPLGYSNFEGVVQAACSKPAKLILSADDLREGGADLRFTIPKELDLSGLEAGTAVDVTGEIDEKTGALTLSGLSSDRGTAAADDPHAAFGDQSVG